MIELSFIFHAAALIMGMLMLHRFGELFQSGRISLRKLDIVEAIYLTVCGSTLLCPVAIYDLLLTIAGKSVITETTMAYMAVSGMAFTAFHLIGYKTMEQVEHDRRRWRIV